MWLHASIQCVHIHNNAIKHTISNICDIHENSTSERWLRSILCRRKMANLHANEVKCKVVPSFHFISFYFVLKKWRFKWCQTALSFVRYLLSTQTSSLYQCSGGISTNHVHSAMNAYISVTNNLCDRSARKRIPIRPIEHNSIYICWCYYIHILYAFVWQTHTHFECINFPWVHHKLTLLTRIISKMASNFWTFTELSYVCCSMGGCQLQITSTQCLNDGSKVLKI